MSLGIAACGQKPTPEPTPVPPTVAPGIGAAATAVPAQLEPTPTTAPTVTLAPAPTSTSVPELSATPAPVATLAPTAVPTPTTAAAAGSIPVPLQLELRLPQEGGVSEVDAVRVIGRTKAGAGVEINGIPAEVGADGSFELDVELQSGGNSIEVTATSSSGESVSRGWEVSFSPPDTGLPFTVFYPPDGLEVSEPVIQVIAGTRPDAVVGVNGVPVEVNILGLFSSMVTLEQGANLVEVVATDLDGNVRSESIAVFYLP
ncbi:MAG: hypothetical protein IH962_02780 [Chloroflexi bacterium]|nr:hypothetical protein [Chloroflexota bacterium]